MDLQRKVGRFAGRVAAVFTREDQFPYYDAMIHDYKEDLEKYPMHTPKEVMKDCVLKLCRAFVHSKDMKDVKEGIQTLQDLHKGVVSPLQLRETLYLLAVGYYRDGDYTSSLSYLDLCLEIAPHFNQALTLKKKFGSVLWFLTGGDHQYYLDMILDCERDITEAGDDIPDEVKNENIIKLSWALVHTRKPEDVHGGIAMLEAPLQKGGLSQLHIRDMLYVRSLGHYLSRDFTKSWNDVCQCLEVAPDFWQGQYLSKTLSTRMENDLFLGELIFYTAVYGAGTIVPIIMRIRSERRT